MKGNSWRWLFLLSGICGSLLLLRSAEGLWWNQWGGYLVEAGILISLWIFFEIFMKRMLLCRRAAERLGLRFQLTINGQQLI